MPSVLAIVSKKIFERDFRAGLGEVVPTTTYASAHPSLAKLADGGDLFLVTVAPGEELWLAGVLAQPKFAKDKWVAKPNTTPIQDLTPLIAQLAFENGKGLSAKPGALAMSLQTPRTLTDGDVVLLRGSKPAAKVKKVEKPAPVAKAKSVEKPRPVTVVVPKGANHLARAQEYLDGGALAEALDELLKAWAQHKAAEIADAIDALGAHISRALPAIEGKKTTIDGAWREVGDAHRPVDVPRLLAAFELGTSGQIEEWLDILIDRFPLDPRICPVAIDTSVKFVASSAGPTRTRANRLAEAIADGRCIPQIDKLIATRMNAWNATELRDRLRKLKTKFAPPPPLAKDAKPTLAAIDKTIAKLAKGPAPDPATLIKAAKKAGDTDGDRLLAEVLADPTSDAPRLVYADWLHEQEDPRGELITLQLLPERTPAQDEQVARLVKKHGKAWLGPLAAVASEPVFERGFVAACKVALKTKSHRELLAHPLWATVHTIECRDPAVVDGAGMKSLRTVRGLPIAALADLAKRSSPVALEALTGVTLDFDDDREQPLRDALCSVGAFEQLRSLQVQLGMWDDVPLDYDEWKWLLDSKLGKQLAHLAIDFKNDPPLVTSWLPAFTASKSLATFGMLTSLQAQHDLTIRRDGKTYAMTYEIARPFDSDGKLRREIENVSPGFFAQGFPHAAMPALDVVVTTKVTKQQLATLEEKLTELVGKSFKTITFAAR